VFNWTKSLVITYGEDQRGGQSELDTVKCNHCGFTMIVKPYQSLDQCKGCMKFVCELCAAKRELGDPCRPEEQRLEEFEKACRIGVDQIEAFRRFM